MFSPRIWLVITLVLLLTLCLLVIWMFSDLELVFPGSERVDRSVRKRLGASVLIITGLEIAVACVIFFNIDSLRYWAGAGGIVVGLFFLGWCDSLRRRKTGVRKKRCSRRFSERNRSGGEVPGPVSRTKGAASGYQAHGGLSCWLPLFLLVRLQVLVSL